MTNFSGVSHNGTMNNIERLKELFADVLEMSDGTREEFITSLRQKEPDLATELASLLAAHTRTDSFLSPLHIPPPLSESTERVGKFIGPYRILREVAQGGMGEVYEAIRDDGVFKKQVAVKFVRVGMSRGRLLERFQRERQTLAHLEHPNIARLLDGGTTDEGIPYLVMEFVDGERIDDYCDKQRLSIEKRLELFLTVCSAVQYAHQRLVVHRDVKPSNILVTPDGEPKLLDFGIAKLLTREDASPESEMTRTGVNAFTPEYASPEQVRGEDVTTSSDVYSLGVLLYKLLTGRKPYKVKSELFHDVAAAILESDAIKPSSKEPVIAAPEGKERVSRILAGDLDNILLMALRKEPARRYASVEQFAEDIRRYLRRLPISARANTLPYRTAKFVRRNRVGVLAASLVVLSLLGGLVATLYQVQVARKEKARAETINGFLKKMLSYSNPMLHLPGDKAETTMKEALDEAARRIESGEMSDQPDVKAELVKIIGESYGYQGRYDLWERYQRDYVSTQEQLYGQNDPRTLVARSAWAALLGRKGDMVNAEKSFREILPLLRAALHAGTIQAVALENALNNFGYLRRMQGDSREAEGLFREVLSLGSLLPPEEQYIVEVTRSTLASALADQGKFNEALETSREAATECRRLGFTTKPDFGFVLTVLGGFLTEKGLLTEADSTLREAELIFRRLLAPSSLWLGDNLRNQSSLCYLQGKYDEAEQKVDETLRIYHESFGDHYDNFPTALSIRGLILNKTGRAVEAEKTLREAVRLRVELLPKGHFFTALAKGALGECLLTQKRYAEAGPLLEESYNNLRATQGPDNPRTLLARHRLDLLYRRKK